MPPHEGKKREKKETEFQRAVAEILWRAGGLVGPAVWREREAPFLIRYGAGVSKFHVPCRRTECAREKSGSSEPTPAPTLSTVRSTYCTPDTRVVASRNPVTYVTRFIIKLEI